MRAMTIPQFGPPSVLTRQDVEEPELRPRDLLIEVRASATNPVDTKIRGGKFRAPLQMPIVPGYDVCGVVRDIGPEVERFKIGDAVYAFCPLFRNGAHAERVAVDERVVAAKPKSVDDATAAAVPLVLVTAWEALYARCAVRSGDTVLIQAGAGGVGHIAIQLAKLRGCRVLATASRDESIALCKDCGADEVINYKQHDVAERVKELTDGRGCDVGLDCAGGEAFKQVVAAAAPEARVATIVGVPKDSDLSPLFLRNASLFTVFIGSAGLFGGVEPRHAQMLEEAADLIDAGQLKPHVSHTFPLEDLAKAHEQQETAHTTGKIAIVVKA